LSKNYGRLIGKHWEAGRAEAGKQIEERRKARERMRIRRRGEMGSIFTMTEFRVSTRNLKISPTPKPFDLSAGPALITGDCNDSQDT